MEPEAFHEMAALEATHWWYVGMRDITRQFLAPYLNGSSLSRILDAGCGTGANLAMLGDYGQTFGLDFSPIAVGYTSKLHPGRVARASVANKPFPDNAFDLVTSFDVLYAKEVGDDQTAITEMGRVAKRGGLVLLRVPAMPILRGPHDTFVHGVRRYVASELCAKMERAGLKVLRTTYANSLLLPLALASRTVQNIGMLLGAKPSSDVGGSNGVVDRVMLGALKAEAKWIGAGRSYPAGVSLFALAQKPVDA